MLERDPSHEHSESRALDASNARMAHIVRKLTKLNLNHNPEFLSNVSVSRYIDIFYFFCFIGGNQAYDPQGDYQLL